VAWKDGIRRFFRRGVVCEGLWIDEGGDYHRLPVACIGIHPQHKVALVKMDHPYGGQFPFIPINYTPPIKGDWALRISRSQKSRIGYPYVGQVLYYYQTQIGNKLPGEGVIGMGCYGKISGSPYINLNGETIGIHNRSNQRESFFTSLSQLKTWIDSIMVRD